MLHAPCSMLHAINDAITLNRYVEGPPGRLRQHRVDEIDRLIAWANIAPPFGAGADANGAPQLIVADDTREGVLWDAWYGRY